MSGAQCWTSLPAQRWEGRGGKTAAGVVLSGLGWLGEAHRLPPWRLSSEPIVRWAKADALPCQTRASLWRTLQAHNSPKLIFLVAGIFIPMPCCFSESVFSVWKLTVKWRVSSMWAWNSVWSLMSGVPEVPSSSWLWHVGALAGSWAHRVESAVYTIPTIRLPPRASPSLGSQWQPSQSPLLLVSHVRHAWLSSLCWS